MVGYNNTMVNKTTPASGEKRKITKSELKERIEAKLVTRGVYDPASATDDQLYQATVLAIKDIMLEYRSDFRKRIRAVDGKKVFDLCMEFLVGRALKNDSMLTGVAWNAPFLPKFYDCVYKEDEAKLAKTLAKLERERLKRE